MSFLQRTPPTEARVRPARVLTAAGRRIELGSGRGATGAIGKLADWQTAAWDYRDTIGEIRYAVQYLRHSASRVRLVPSVAAPDNSPPAPLTEADGVPAGVLEAANDALARLTGGTFQYAELLAPFAENLEVAGEAVLVGYDDPDRGETWAIRSVDEIVRKDRGYMLIERAGATKGIALTDDNAYVARLWHPHARWRALPDSPMRALLQPCEELRLVSQMVRAATKSRLAGAGVLLLPDGLTFSRRSGAETDPEQVDDDPFMAELTEAMVTPIQDEGDASAVVPILLRGEAEYLKEVRHLQLAGNVDKELLARGERALQRIGTGLDVPPEIITGVSDVNHWSAWQIDDSTIRNHVGPLVVRMVDAITAGYLRSVLAEDARVPKEWVSRVVLWFNLAPLTTRSDRSGDAKDAWDRNTITDRALVEALGFDPDVDMPTEEELARRLVMRRGIMDSPITEALLSQFVTQLLDVRRIVPPGQVTVHTGQDAQQAERALPAVAPAGTPATQPPTATGPAEDQPAPDQPASTPGPRTALPAAGPPAVVLRAYQRESRRLADVDRQLRDRLTAAADAAMTRAVERAAARIRSAAQRDPQLRARVATLTGQDVPAQLGPVLVASLGLDLEQLLEGAWTALRAQWAEWTAAARDTTVSTAAQVAAVAEDAPAVQALAGALQVAGDDGWEWLSPRLTQLAGQIVYAKEAADDDRGETPGIVGRITSLIRGALAVAGRISAAAGGVTDQGLPVNAGTRLGGPSTGDLVTQFLVGAGKEELGYEWVYGISVRHFQPHRALDGVIFADFDSPVLVNPTGWPFPILGPGDHIGCHCDASPVWADGTNTAQVQQAAGDLTYDRSYLDVLDAMAAEDTAAGRTGTSAQAVSAEARRVAQSRPSQQTTRRAAS